MTSNINRRSVVKGAAWAAPAVAATAAIPAYAASSPISPETCTNIKSFSWADYTRDQGLQLRNGQSNLSGSATSGSQTVSVTHVSHSDAHFQSVDMLTPFNKTMGWGDVNTPFAQSSDFLNFQTTNKRSSGRNSTITLTFNPPVYNLSLPILDVDKGSTVSGGPWEDNIIVSGAEFTAVTSSTNKQVGNTIVGTSDALDNTGNGNVTLNFKGPVSTISLKWTNGSQNGSQRIGIGAFTYCNENSSAG